VVLILEVESKRSLKEILGIGSEITSLGVIRDENEMKIREMEEEIVELKTRNEQIKDIIDFFGE
jgi:hypothetical protein